MNELLKLDLHLLEFDPLHASTYLALPKWIKDKHGVINIKNTDNKCFLWTAIAGIYGDSANHRHDRTSHYKQWVNELDVKGIPMPVALKDIPKFECQNDVSVSVYTFEEARENEKSKSRVDH